MKIPRAITVWAAAAGAHVAAVLIDGASAGMFAPASPLYDHPWLITACVAGGSVAAAILVTWPVLAVLARARGLRWWTAAAGGVVAGLAVTFVFTAALVGLRNWETIDMLGTAVRICCVVEAGVLAGWAAWRLTQPRVTPAEGVF